MDRKYNNTIFLDDFNSTHNWTLFRDYKNWMGIIDSSLKFTNNSKNIRNLIITKSHVLPDSNSQNYEIEAKIKICDDLNDKQLVSLAVGNDNFNVFNNYFKFSFNNNSWVEIRCEKKRNILMMRDKVVLFSKITNIPLNSEFNFLKIINEADKKMVTFYLNNVLVFNTINKNVDLKKIGFECPANGSMVIDCVTLKI